MRSPELAPGDGRDLEWLRDKARTSQIPNDRSRDFHVQMNMANRIEGNFCSLIKGSYKKSRVPMMYYGIVHLKPIIVLLTNAGPINSIK